MSLIKLSEEKRNRLRDDEYNQLEQNAWLLMTSNGADCLISCGGKTVKLHRKILCGRSKFFRAALTGGFMESRSQMVVLQEVVTHHMLYRIILFIYLFIPKDGFGLEEVYGPTNDANFYEIVFELYRQADYLQVQDLKIAIMRELDTRLNESAMILWRAYPSVSDPVLFKRALQDSMTAAVAAFDRSQEYYDVYEPLRAKIFTFVERCYPVLCRRGDEFEDYLRQAPELSLAILKKMRNIKKSSFITPGPDARCMFCNDPVWESIPCMWRGQPQFGITADINGIVRNTCTITDWSGGHYGPLYANFYVSGPQTTSGGITILALSLTRRCTAVGAVGSVTDCSDLIVNNSDGRKLTASFLESSDVATLVTYTFNSGGKTHKITGTVVSAASGVSKSFTITPNSID